MDDNILDNILLKAILNTSSEGIVISDAENNIIAINNSFTDIIGYQAEEVLGKPGKILRSDKYDDAFYENFWNEVKLTGSWKGEMWVRRTDGSAIFEWLIFTVIKNEKNQVQYYLSIFSDTERTKMSSQYIDFIRNYDPLTRLPNLLNISNQIKAYLVDAQHSDSSVGIFYLGLNNFKNFNAAYNWACGDTLLQIISARLQNLFHNTGSIARVAGDCFLVVIPSLTNADAAARVAKEILDALHAICKIKENEIRITTSIGISMYPGDGKKVETLVKHAEIAMFQAKEKAGNDFQFFIKEMQARAVENITIEGLLRSSIGSADFELYYQPIIDVKTKKLSAVEALLRWKGPADVSLATLLTVAEETGLINDLTKWIIRQACKDRKKWGDEFSSNILVALNIPASLFKSEAFKLYLLNEVKKFKLQPNNFKLEITESILMDEIETSVKNLEIFKSKGFYIAIDDFGTGYSSLNYLARLPLDDLKIDQSFVREVNTNKSMQAIVLAIISIAKSLGLSIIAEGVETKEQGDYLIEKGCHYIQGYFFSKPVSASELIPLFTKEFN